MNTRGQAYSVFKLLIAAIVAVAILYILLSILGVFPRIGGDILTVSANSVQKMSTQLASFETSANVIFKGDSSLSPLALVGNSGLSEDQVCLHKGDHAGREEIRVTGNSLFNSGSDLELRVSVVCHLSKDLLNTINEMPLGYEVGFDGDEGVCSCPLDSETGTQKCCAVILRYAS